MSIREDVLHYHVRQELRRDHWKLLAGQYPNGSDDELPTLYITDPEVARDRSPNARGHSLKKLVPDLVAVRNSSLLVIEMKPGFDRGDEKKLLDLVSDRFDDFEAAFDKMSSSLRWGLMLRNLEVIPCLAFDSSSSYESRDDFAYALIDQKLRLELRMPPT